MDNEELPESTPDSSEVISPLEVKITNPPKPKSTPYESKDAEIEDMYLSKEEIEEFENGT